MSRQSKDRTIKIKKTLIITPGGQGSQAGAAGRRPNSFAAGKVRDVERKKAV